MYIMIDIFLIAFIPIQAAGKYMLLSKKCKQFFEQNKNYALKANEMQSNSVVLD